MNENKTDKRSGLMLQGILSLAVMVSVIVLALVAANWIPGTFDSTLMREYGSIGEVREKLRIKTLYVPIYFPETISWPPSKVLAQRNPYEAVVMEFEGVEEGRPLLVISQSVSGDFLAFERLRMVEVAEHSTYEFKGRQALLSAGTCNTGRRCSMLSWSEDPYHIRVLMSGDPFGLISVAQSMVSGDQPPQSLK